MSMKIQNQPCIKSKEAKIGKDQLKAQVEDAVVSICPWKRGLEVLQEIRLSEGRITYTYTIYLTWIGSGSCGIPLVIYV